MKNTTATKLILLAIALLATLGQFARAQTLVGAINWYEPLMLLLVIYSVVPDLKAWRQLFHNLGGLLVLIWVSWILASTIFNSWSLALPDLLINGGAYLARTGLYILFGASLSVLVSKQVISKQYLQRGLLITLVLQMIIGLGQYLLFPDTRILFYLGWDDHLSRAFGTLFDPGFFGLIMVLGVLVCAQLLNTKYRRFLVALLAMFMLAVAVSFSRASYLALTAGVLVFSFHSSQRRWWLLIPLLLLTLLLVPKDGGGEGQNLLRTQSVAERSEIAQKHLDRFPWQQWMVGRGWYYQSVLNYHGDASTDNIPQHSQAVDNIYLHIFLSAGAVGLFLTAMVIGYLFVVFRSESLILASGVAVLTHSFFSTALFYPWVMLAMGVLTVAFFAGKKPSSHYKGN